MANWRQFLVLSIGLILGAGALVIGFTWNKPVSDVPADTIAPGALFAASFPDLTGTMRSFGEWGGKLVVLNFWATWCGPCREEIPIFVKLQDKYRAQGVIFVGLAIDQKDNVSPYAKAMQMNYPILLGELEGSDFARRIGNDSGGLPFTVLIDRRGNVIATHLGGIGERELERMLQQSLL